MNRYDFTREDFSIKELLDQDEDMKAIGAFFLVKSLLDRQENFVLAMVALDCDRAGMSMPEYAQYFYDNYSDGKIALMGQMLLDPNSVEIEKKSYETEEEFQQMLKETELPDGI